VKAAARQWGAETAAVEGGYVGANPRSALGLGQARAAAIIGLADAGLAVVEYAPRLVKQAVAGYGHGSKEQVAEMVRLQLRLDTLPTPTDAADALAIAITHWAQARLEARL
jgi:crossover junction endodeoxyribonuclease RuvC